MPASVAGSVRTERCQVAAIEEGEGVHRIIRERCIGCGLCIGTCPAGAIRLFHKEGDTLVPPPMTEDAWFDERGKQAGGGLLGV